MAGWSSSGWRVYLGTSESEEFWYVYTFNVFTPNKKRRIIKVERAEWRGLTEAGAQDKVATSGWTITARDRVDDSGQWKVTEEYESKGEWEVVE